jgi:cytochrome c oxidase subunit 2
MSTWLNINLQERASPLIEQLIFFHDHSLLIITIITIIVAYIIISITTNKISNNLLIENQYIETVWTIIPGIILLFIALPSLRLLYLLDELKLPNITIKTIGHQWYWSYEYSDFSNIEFDSFMIPSNENKVNDFRLLEVTNRTVIPLNSQTRVLVSSADVIHSWTIPSAGVKIDANPGRLNQTSINFNRPGLFYGQCSEICGAVHSFIPIVVEVTEKTDFIKWIKLNNQS